MKLSQLHNLLAVAEHGSVRRAARELNLSQPAVTKSIQQLEESLDVSLLDRGAHGVTPTQAGLALIERAKAVEAELRSARAEIEKLMGSDSGEIAVGVTPAIMEYLMPVVLAEFKKTHPNVFVRIYESVGPGYLADLRTGELDFGISLLPDTAVLATQGLGEDFDYEPLAEGQLVPLVRRGHPLTERSAVDLPDLQEWEWVIIGPNRGTTHVLDTIFSARNLETPKCSIETNTYSSATGLVQRTDMIALGLQEGSHTHGDNSPIVPLHLKTEMPSWTIAAITRARSHLSPAAKELLGDLRRLTPLTTSMCG